MEDTNTFQSDESLDSTSFIDVANRRARAEAFLDEQHVKLDAIEAELRDHLSKVSSEMSESHQQSSSDREALQQRADAIHAQAADLQRIKDALSAEQDRWNRIQQELAAEQQATDERLAAKQSTLSQQQADLQTAREQLASDQGSLDINRSELDAKRQRYEERLAELDELQEKLDAEKADTRRKRRRIAAQFKEERTQLHQQLRKQQDQQSKQTTALPIAGGDESAGAISEEMANLQHRFELAVEDVRQLKDRNRELEGMLAKAAPTMSGDGFDWEVEKKRMFDSLGTDFDSSNAQDKADRLTIEGTIQITDEIIAQKDREIGELQQMLKEQSGAIGENVVGAGALAEMLGADELVQQERDRLQSLQQELNDKLRSAEIELSMERAKMARQKVEIDEKMRLYESEQSQHQQADEEPKKGSKSGQGRWLSRLGLSEMDDK